MVTSDAGSLGCPRCGAPASPEATACPYCRTPLALVACPSCFAKLFKGYRHCPRCGTAAARQESADASGRRCPHCQEALGTAQVGSVRLGECGSCGGVWADSASFETICKAREEQAIVLGTAFPAPAAREGEGPAAGAPSRYRPCPECSRLMNRMNFARCSGVVVDVCKAHGVFFDHDELRRIVEFIRDGGMDRARQLEKDDLREQRERLRNEQQAAAQAQRRSYDGSFGADTDTSRLAFDDVLDLGDVVSVARDLVDWFRKAD